MASALSRRAHRRGGAFHEPSLVPLADMLTNTVGIVVFILIFTVLTASGTVIAKVLPVEHTADVVSPEYLVCAGGRIYPLRASLIAEATKHDARPERSGEGAAPPPAETDAPRTGEEKPSLARQDYVALANELDGRTVSDEHLSLHVSAAAATNAAHPGLDLEIACDPVDGGGLDAAAIGRGEGFFAEDLAKLDPKTSALVFWVRPDGIAVYLAARERASLAGVASNWVPRVALPIAFRLGGGLDGPLTIQSGK